MLEPTWSDLECELDHIANFESFFRSMRCNDLVPDTQNFIKILTKIETAVEPRRVSRLKSKAYDELARFYGHVQFALNLWSTMRNWSAYTQDPAYMTQMPVPRDDDPQSYHDSCSFFSKVSGGCDLQPILDKLRTRAHFWLGSDTLIKQWLALKNKEIAMAKAYFAIRSD